MKESTKRKVASTVLLRFIPMCVAICIAMNLFGAGNTANATGLTEENKISESGAGIGEESETQKNNDVTTETAVGIEAETKVGTEAEAEVEAEATVKTEE